MNFWITQTNSKVQLTILSLLIVVLINPQSAAGYVSSAEPIIFSNNRQSPIASVNNLQCQINSIDNSSKPNKFNQYFVTANRFSR